ncbi:MAG TPA: YwqG family protein [Ktedonosporobacter sp.]|nr:YwqG family protein [Ktedonosporobacter sp.]
MDKAGTQAAFVAAGLGRLLKDLDALARNSIRLTTTPIDEARMRIGASKVGGRPDLPRGVSWPQWKGLPQSFIAQIRLKDASTYDSDKVLPADGMLWFFYDEQQEIYGASPDDRGGWSVIYKAGKVGRLRPTRPPTTLPATSHFKASSVRFSGEITLSDQPQLEIPNLDWTDEEMQQYETLLSTFPTPADHGTTQHRLLGNPYTLQDDMHLQCQLYSHGVTDINDPRVEELSKGAIDWLLLLQIDTDEEIGMRWGSTGMLYYWIKREDLQAGTFDNTWLVLQSE